MKKLMKNMQSTTIHMNSQRTKLTLNYERVGFPPFIFFMKTSYCEKSRQKEKMTIQDIRNPEKSGKTQNIFQKTIDKMHIL